MSLEKISAATVNAVLTKTAGVLRAQAARIQDLESELARHHRREGLTEIAKVASSRGTIDDDDIESFVDRWAEDETPLPVLEDFVTRAPSGVPLARLSEGGISKEAGANQDVLSSFLLTAEPGSY